MLAAVAPVSALLLSVAILLAGSGLQGTLLPLRAEIEAFSGFDIGALGSAYYAGFGIGCYYGGRVIERAGHIRTFTAMVAIASTTALVHALLLSPWAWWFMRGVTGFCFAVLYIVIESWLNERSTNENRGLIFSIYTIINLTVISLGQMMVTLYDPAAFPLFCIASIMVSLAAVPVALTTSPAPAPIQQVELHLVKLYKASPVGFMGCLVVGLANGSFWSLAPVFGTRTGLSIAEVAIFMSATVIGGAIGQYPLGHLSDKMDRRRVIAGACIGGLASALLLIFLGNAFQGASLLFGAAFGAFAMPLYSLSVAHTNDYVKPEEYVATSGGLLLIFAVGAVVGPMISGLVMGPGGANGLFIFTAVMHALMLGFTLFRMTRRAAPPEEHRVDFAATLRETTTVAPLEFEETPPEEAAAETQPKAAEETAAPTDGSRREGPQPAPDGSPKEGPASGERSET